MPDLAQSLSTLEAGPMSVLLASFLGPYVFPAAGELAVVAAIGLGIDVWLVLVLGIVGSVMSDQLGYGIGRAGGSPIADRMLLPSKREALEERVHRHATKALIPGRLLPGVRTWIAILAGIARMPHARFSTLNFAGCVLWSVTFTTIGVVFGATVDVEAIVASIRHWEVPIFVTICALFLARMLYVRMAAPSTE